VLTPRKQKGSGGLDCLLLGQAPKEDASALVLGGAGAEIGCCFCHCDHSKHPNQEQAVGCGVVVVGVRMLPSPVFKFSPPAPAICLLQLPWRVVALKAAVLIEKSTTKELAQERTQLELSSPFREAGFVCATRWEALSTHHQHPAQLPAPLQSLLGNKHLQQ